MYYILNTTQGPISFNSLLIDSKINGLTDLQTLAVSNCSVNELKQVWDIVESLFKDAPVSSEQWNWYEEHKFSELYLMNIKNKDRIKILEEAFAYKSKLVILDKCNEILLKRATLIKLYDDISKAPVISTPSAIVKPTSTTPSAEKSTSSTIKKAINKKSSNKSLRIQLLTKKIISKTL